MTNPGVEEVARVIQSGPLWQLAIPKAERILALFASRSAPEGRVQPPASEAELTEADAIAHPHEVLHALRNWPRADRITIWKDGSWKRWQGQDAIYARSDPDWLSEIPAEELSAARPKTEGA